MVVAIISIAQERSLPSATDYYSFDRNVLGKNYSVYTYDGGASDYLIPTTRDTIDFRFDTKKHNPFDFNITMVYDTIAGIDTTVTVLVLGRNNDYEAWTTISTNVSAVVSAQITQTIASVKTASIASAVDIIHQQTTTNADTINVAARTITFTNKSCYQQICIRAILTGNDSVGTGAKIIYVALKTFE
jgi:hypothetical protein